jgi:hypothetical protein
MFVEAAHGGPGGKYLLKPGSWHTTGVDKFV